MGDRVLRVEHESGAHRRQRRHLRLRPHGRGGWIASPISTARSATTSLPGRSSSPTLPPSSTTIHRSKPAPHDVEHSSDPTPLRRELLPHSPVTGNHQIHTPVTAKKRTPGPLPEPSRPPRVGIRHRRHPHPSGSARLPSHQSSGPTRSRRKVTEEPDSLRRY